MVLGVRQFLLVLLLVFLNFHEVVRFGLDLVVNRVRGSLVIFVGFLLFDDVAVESGRGEVLDYATFDLRGKTSTEVIEKAEHCF